MVRARGDLYASPQKLVREHLRARDEAQPEASHHRSKLCTHALGVHQRVALQLHQALHRVDVVTPQLSAVQLRHLRRPKPQAPVRACADTFVVIYAQTIAVALRAYPLTPLTPSHSHKDR